MDSGIGEWSTVGLAVASSLRTLSTLVTWDEVKVEGNALVYVIVIELERYYENCEV